MSAVTDGGIVLGKCTTATSAVTTYISDSGPIPPTTPMDRAGNPIYGAVNMSGNHDTGCRFIPVYGHPQDYSRRLINQDYGTTLLGWEERGVELYENFGMSTDKFSKPGNYGQVGPENDVETSGDVGNVYYATKCPKNTATDIGTGTYCQNRCITELGRKLTLFGQMGFCFFDANTATAQPYDKQGPGVNYVTQIVYPNGLLFNLSARPAGFTPSPGGKGYIFNFRNQVNQPSDRYDYFGNSGVLVRDANGVQFGFFQGVQPFIIRNGSKTFVSQDQLTKYTLNDSSNNSFYVDIQYFTDQTITDVVGLNSDGITASIGHTGDCSSGGNTTLDNLSQPAVAIPFPGNWYSQLFCATGKTDATGFTNFANCNYSGFRSMYIPPHMRVEGFSTLEYVGNNQTWSSQTGTQVYQIVSHTLSTPFMYDDSPYSNGTFPSLAGPTANSPLESTARYTSGSYFNPPIHNCSLFAIFVGVRRDIDFYNRYVSYGYSNSRLLPEIFLIPGIEQSNTFITSLTTTPPEPNELQKITDPRDFWSTNNPYWDGKSTVQLNLQKQPYDVFPVSASTQTVAATASLSDKIINLVVTNNFTKNKLNKYLNPVKSKMMKASLFANPSGGGRIVAFKPINGIMSIEWLYVVYRCAFAYSPKVSNSLIYDTTTGQYQCNDNNSSCFRECMLFRDPYYISNPTNASISDTFMKTYCFMKNLSLCYTKYSNPASNDCSCTSAMAYCPAKFNTTCDPSKSGDGNIYVPDGTIEQGDTCGSVCSYCKIVNLQLNIQDGQISSAPNDNIKNNNTCSGNSSCIEQTSDQNNQSTDTSGTGGGSGSGTQNDNTNQGNVSGDKSQVDQSVNMQIKNWAMILLVVIVVLVIAVAIGYPAYKIYKNK